MPYAGLHSGQTSNHRLESYVFADAASRSAGTGYTITADDIGRVGYQQDTETYYRLVGVSPLAWIPIGGGGSQAPADGSFVTMVPEARLTNEYVLGVHVIMYGLLSARPTPGLTTGLLYGGPLYYATDEQKLYRDSGTTWDELTFAWGTITAKPASVIVVEFDGGADAIAVGTTADFWAPYTGTIQGVTLLADQVGSIQVDIWKDTYANYPPTDADSITAAAVPAITAAVKYQDATLTGWTTAVTSGDCLRFNVDSCTTIRRCTLILKVAKTA